MSDTTIASLVGGLLTLLGVIITAIITIYTAHLREKREHEQREHQIKRDNLTEVYKNLISAINLFPSISPNDIMNDDEYAPSYSSESFDITLECLDIQIEFEQGVLKNSKLTYDEKNKVETKIANLKYFKKNIIRNKEKYFEAKKELAIFDKEHRKTLSLYAGPKVQVCLYNFEVIIHNVFTSGYRAQMIENNVSINIISKSRSTLIYALREDIGTN